MKKTTIVFVSLIGVMLVCSIISLILSISRISKEEQFKNRLIDDYFSIQVESRDRNDMLHSNFVKNCLLARQVYQLYWYEQVPTKLGMLNLKKRYAMSLQEFNEIVEMSWKFNRYLGLPKDSPENYYMISKWTMESAICNQVEHKTGEIIKMLGYTESGVRFGIFIYEHILNIQKGHPFYIEGLHSGISVEEIKRIFEDSRNCVRFDYAVFQYLLSAYGYSWEWALTSFHYGDDKTSYWKEAGLKMIPNYRVDGKWSAEWIRKYYQTIMAIGQAMYEGQTEIVSRYEETIGNYAKISEANRKYIETMKIKLRTEEKAEQIEKKYIALGEEFKDYKLSNEEILQNMARLNDLNLELRNYQEGEKKNQLREMISNLKRALFSAYKKLIRR